MFQNYFRGIKKKDRKKRILFAGISPTNFVQFAPIYEVLKQDSRIEVFLSGMSHGKDRPQDIYRYFDVDKKFIIKEKVAKRFYFDIYVSPDFHLVGKRHGVSVQMFHGNSFRNFSINEEAKNFDHLFLMGSYMKRKFLELGIFKEGESRFEEIGMPQTDALLNNTDTGLREKLNLNKKFATVLYAPVWAHMESFLEDVRRTLQELTSLEVNLLVKMHHGFYSKELNKIKWQEYLDELLKKNINMHLIKDFDIVPYMRISDLLVSDASGVVHQFSILDRPIVCIKIDIDEFRKGYPNLDQAAYANRAVVEVSTGESLKEAVLKELADPGRLSRQRLAMAKEYFYNIGFSTKYAISRLYRFLNKEPLQYREKEI
ncbi:MAG: CDP-glycerol glycerophosphotransferase family protein [Candidatus Gorgyraea atricola]|nr:CDP-glycerol glycerophosphotransferase family protein [Candidatus Gorgyraea atricola]